MYCGRLVEAASRDEFFHNPKHPYSQGLLECIPYIGMSDQELYHIPGNVMHPADDKGGCSFASRCPHADERCRQTVASMMEDTDGHFVRCWLYEKETEASEGEGETNVSAGNE